MVYHLADSEIQEEAGNQEDIYHQFLAIWFIWLE